MNTYLKGIGASDGIAVAKAHLLKEVEFDFNRIQFTSVNDQLDVYEKAKVTAIEQLKKIVTITRDKFGEQKAEVFDAQILMISDEEINSQVVDLINNQIDCATAIKQAYDSFITQFEMIDDPYFKERVSDLTDVSNRLLSVVLNQPLPDLIMISEPCIIVAHDLTPSDTAQLDPNLVKGFVANIGGKTSHAAIMARTLEIPAVLSLKNVTQVVKQNDLIGIDGSSGDVCLITDSDQHNVWLKKQDSFLIKKSELEQYKKIDPITLDGHKVHVEGNIGNHHDVDKVIEYGGKGVGLFRSEFLYMDNSNWPDEQTQFLSYKSVLEKVPNDLVIIRTLDIGGDKRLSYYTFPNEMNPFLGYRALRLCLDQQEIFKTQLRALLRASVYGKLGIMFPMVTTISEFIQAKEITDQVANELRSSGHVVSDNYQVGMMIEVPTAAVFANEFAKYADFFSIGSNDLIQYSMAVDRMSSQVTSLYQPNFPGILKMIQLAIDGAHSNNKMIGMCGEMASDLKSIPLLLGLGLDAFSMSSTAIPAAKRLISKLNYSECKTLVQKALTLSSECQVNVLVSEFLNDRGI